MKETLYLNNTNFGLWSIYRKKCKTETDIKNDYCQKLYTMLFCEKNKN